MQEMQKFVWCHPWIAIISIALYVVLMEYSIKTVWLRILWVYFLFCLVGVMAVGFGSWGESVNVRLSYGLTFQKIINELYNSSNRNDAPTLQSQINCLHSRSADCMKTQAEFSKLEYDISSMSSSSNLLMETNNRAK